MTQRWAAEPWKVAPNQFFIKGEEGWGSVVNEADWFIAKIEDSLDPAANADRIVACVNGLRGKDPQRIDSVVEVLRHCIASLQDAAPSLPSIEQRSQVSEAARRAQEALTGFLQVTD